MNYSTYLIIFSLVFIISILVSYSMLKTIGAQKIKKELEFDIDINQMIECEDRIDRFILDNKLDDRRNLADIAGSLNVYKGHSVKGLRHQGQIEEPDINGRMYVNFAPNLTGKQRNFVFAHECGHIINGDAVPNAREEGYGKPVAEQLADYTGAALLMPYDEVKIKIDKASFNDLSKRDKGKFIRSMSNEYQVSEITVLKRIKEVEAIVASKINAVECV